MTEIGPAVIIASISCAISLSSFILAAWSLRISHLNRRLSLSQEERKLPKIVVESLRNFEESTGDNTYYAAFISVNNISENSNSLKSAELVIYFSSNVQNSALRLNPIKNETDLLDEFEERIKVPSQITGNNTIQGWLVFQAPSSFINGKEIKQFDLEIGDIHAKIEPIKDLIFLRKR